MLKKYLWALICCLMAMSLVIASCSTTETGVKQEEDEQEEVKIEVTEGKTEVEQEREEEITGPEGPQYGGTITLRRTADPNAWDPFFFTGFEGTMFMESLARRTLEVGPEVFDFMTRFYPEEYRGGALAESWEANPEMTKLTFHVRQGVNWQNLPPVNGREFTAYDIEYHYHRMLGIGSGFTTGSPNISLASFRPISTVTATDKYTVVFDLKESSLQLLDQLTMDSSYGYIECREAVEQWGDANDAKHAIGTGPFMVDDYVSGSSSTFVRNPDYWRTDALYPENQLPYADKAQLLIIPDDSTAIAALRTGNIDLLDNISWERVARILETNPDMLKAPTLRDGIGIGLVVDKAPYNDLRVRRAMQMAMDLETIAATYYGGTVDPKPAGLQGTIFKGYYVPYDEWPQDVKDGYAYNPEGARALLAEAGYPDGFKCTLTAASNADLDLYQIAAAYLSDIGIEMELDVIEASSYITTLRAEKHEMFTTTSTQNAIPPRVNVNRRYSGHPNYTQHHIKDAIFDDLTTKILYSLDQEEVKALCKEADMRAIEQQWVVDLLSPVTYNLYQPWIHNFSGQNLTELGNLVAWMWVDKDLKASR